MAKKRTIQILVGLILLMTIINVYAISFYQFFPWKNIAYVLFGITSVLSIALIVSKKYDFAKFLLGLSAATSSAGLIIHSMLNGIEIVVGPKKGNFLFLKEQYGLINTRDLCLIVIILIVITVTLSLINKQSDEAL